VGSKFAAIELHRPSPLTIADLHALKVKQRLRDFLIFRFGVPQRYIEQRGHPRSRARHLPFRINQAARDRWMQLMNNAFGSAGLPQEVEHQLRSFFEQTSTFTINQQT
jgi:hemoglobin